MKMKKFTTEDLYCPLTAEQEAELAALATWPDEDINLSDIPELTDKFWQNAKQGQFCRPLKQQLTLRLDADVVAWFKAQAPEGGGSNPHQPGAAAIRDGCTSARPSGNRKINLQTHFSSPALTEY